MIIAGSVSDDEAKEIWPLGEEPAYVYCNSGGTIGLELVARHPERVRTLVAREAPTAESEEMLGRMAGNFDLLVGWPERPERTLASASSYRPLECTRSTL
jgi:pimeloyl-ACP methyl ester carboxylesterase